MRVWSFCAFEERILRKREGRKERKKERPDPEKDSEELSPLLALEL